MSLVPLPSQSLPKDRLASLYGMSTHKDVSANMHCGRSICPVSTQCRSSSKKARNIVVILMPVLYLVKALAVVHPVKGHHKQNEICIPDVQDCDVSSMLQAQLMLVTTATDRIS